MNVRVAFVVEEEIWRAVPRVEVWDGVVILIEAEIIAVEAEIDIEASIAVVIGDGRMGEGSLRAACETECIAL